jgi:hypothetical protein
MGIKEDIKDGGWRKLLVPGAASLVGAGAGLALTRAQNLRSALPKKLDGVGDLADDLRGKLNSVIGKDSGSTSTTSASSRTPLTGEELEQRRSERQERRKQRAGR